MNGAHREDQAVCSHQHSAQQCESLQDSRLLAQVRFYSAGLQTSSCVTWWNGLGTTTICQASRYPAM